MNAPLLYVQLDKVPQKATQVVGEPLDWLTESLGKSLQADQFLLVDSRLRLPCTKHRPVIIVSGIWDCRVFSALPSRIFLWLQEARRNKCPIFGFGFAHLVLNAAFGGLNANSQYPGLKFVHKNNQTNDFLTSALPAHFVGWSVCTQRTSSLPYGTEILALTAQPEPMLVRYDARTYSTPLSLALGWSGMTLWLHHHWVFIAGNESILEHRPDTGPSLTILDYFLRIWGPCDCPQ